ncbi:hypothetical protein GCM10025857_12130 [Alicyclobacillus contaminans]|uniref:universal stress protein n=1 Tax=Alicyclobacillus contaminans TaxID=392016 RepID=UPI00040DAC11|nr:universal stress protein [Alicyclobacillus contaminans]GMA49856.1 hypothetical protein GCM10025857_12130 [Alicyclobacillus contaminans]
MNRILLAMKTPTLSERAVAVIRDLMQAWPKAEWIVLHVIPDIQPDSVYPYQALLPREVARENGLADQIETFVRTTLFQDHVDRMEFCTVIGKPAPSICVVAEDRQADLILLDHRRNGKVDRMLLGSVSYGVAHMAQVPVLLMK